MKSKTVSMEVKKRLYDGIVVPTMQVKLGCGIKSKIKDLSSRNELPGKSLRWKKNGWWKS